MEKKIGIVGAITLTLASIAFLYFVFGSKPPSEEGLRKEVEQYVDSLGWLQKGQLTDLKISELECKEQREVWYCKSRLDYTDTSTQKTYTDHKFEYWSKTGNLTDSIKEHACPPKFIWDTLMRHSQYTRQGHTGSSWDSCSGQGPYTRVEYTTSYGLKFSWKPEDGLTGLQVVTPDDFEIGNIVRKQFGLRIGQNNDLRDVKCTKTGANSDLWRCPIKASVDTGRTYMDILGNTRRPIVDSYNTTAIVSIENAVAVIDFR